MTDVVRARYSRELKSPRAKALEAGLMYYTMNKPCANGHTAPRLAKSAQCTLCRVEIRQARKERDLARWRERYSNDPAFRAASQKRQREAHRTPEFLAKQREYKRRRYRDDPQFREARKTEAMTGRKQAWNSGSRWALGVTKEAFSAMLAEQHDACAICSAPLKDGPYYTHLDHNHETGQVRGVLCRGCNLGLGNFRDDPARMHLAIQYLEKHAARSERDAA